MTNPVTPLTAAELDGIENMIDQSAEPGMIPRLLSTVRQIEQDSKRVDYLMDLFTQVMPLRDGEGPLTRAEVDQIMSLWPSPASCIAAMSPPGAAQ